MSKTREPYDATPNAINVGDRVQWVRGNKRHSGVVLALDKTTGYAAVQPLDRPTARTMPRISELKRIAAEPVRAVAAQPQDDFADALAVHPAPFALLCEDYELMTGQAGSLGGTELA